MKCEWRMQLVGSVWRNLDCINLFQKQENNWEETGSLKSFPANKRFLLDQVVCHGSVNVLSRIYGSLCGPLQIPGGPPVIHLDHVENHCFRRIPWIYAKTRSPSYLLFLSNMLIRTELSSQCNPVNLKSRRWILHGILKSLVKICTRMIHLMLSQPTQPCEIANLRSGKVNCSNFATDVLVSRSSSG